jgi:hypothetical protein
MAGMGKFLIAAGAGLMLLGALLLIASRYPGRFGFGGGLPGDIFISRGNFSFYFPVVTCILVSAVLSILVWLFLR